MAMQLQNSVFVHIPKCGGRWVQQQIQAHVRGYSFIGDPIYDAHESPDTHFPVFAFVRHPLTFAHSLWLHRSRKKNNRRGHKWNWQQNIKLENVCGTDDYDRYFQLIADNAGVITDYYEHYIGKYKDIQIGKMENIANDLVRILNKNGEDFDRQAILQNRDKIIGNAPNNMELKVNPEIAATILENERGLCERFGYGIDTKKDYRSHDIFRSRR